VSRWIEESCQAGGALHDHGSPAWHAHHGQHRAAVPLEDVEELPHARDPGDDDVIAQEDTEGRLPHHGARAEDGVAETQRLLLPHVGHRGHLRDGLDLTPRCLIANPV
jgi:hypothetical protein